MRFLSKISKMRILRFKAFAYPHYLIVLFWITSIFLFFFKSAQSKRVTPRHRVKIAENSYFGQKSGQSKAENFSFKKCACFLTRISNLYAK